RGGAGHGGSGRRRAGDLGRDLAAATGDRAQAGPGAGTADPGDSRAVPLRRGAVARPGCDPARSVHLLAAQPGRRGARADRAADRPARAAAGTSRAAAGGPGAGHPGRYRGAGPLRSADRDAYEGISAILGGIAVQDLSGVLTEMPSQALVDVLVAGITVAELRELGVAPRSISLQRAGSDDLVLDPLPNHLFTRDPSAWIGDVAAISPMRHRARRRESLHLETIYRRHPLFTGSGAPARILAPDLGQATTATVEGGDVMMLSPRTVAVGLSERSSAVGIERLAAGLLEHGRAEKVIAVALPHRRSMMHLDTVTTVIASETMLRYGPLGRLETFEITRA